MSDTRWAHETPREHAAVLWRTGIEADPERCELCARLRLWEVPFLLGESCARMAGVTGIIRGLRLVSVRDRRALLEAMRLDLEGWSDFTREGRS